MTSPLRLLALLFVIAVVSCVQPELRGIERPSADGKTYLKITDNNGGRCWPFFLDGKEWKHPIGVAAPVAPGTHSLRCGSGGDVEFEVRPGTTFEFNYWGP